MEITDVGPIRKAVLPEPFSVIWHPDTPRGKVNQFVNRAKDTYGRYFQGKDPLVKTKAEEEASK
jgi:hypothetical protein